jgi:thymidylate synthase (FAD)
MTEHTEPRLEDPALPDIVVHRKVVERPGEAPIITAWSDYVPVLGLGYLRLEAALASDLDPVNAARVSFDGRSFLHHEGCQALEVVPKGTRAKDCTCSAKADGDGTLIAYGDERLINFLAGDRHGTPFEHAHFRWEWKAPILVFREGHRHRVGHSYNEQSGRYMQLSREFYVPAAESFRQQRGKAGAYYFVADPDTQRVEAAQALMEKTNNAAFDAYEEMLAAGVPKELSRSVLPVSTFSTQWWSNNPRSLMAFLSLRNAPNAQWEIRQYARVAEAIVRQVMPVTFERFIEHGRQAV